MALLWGRECRWEHGQVNYPNAPYDPVGQNLYVTTANQLGVDFAIRVSSLQSLAVSHK